MAEIAAEDTLLRARKELDPRLVLLAHPDSARAAAFRQLCEGLLDGGPRVIAVTSAAPSEGKTCCAVNLALAFAEQRVPRVLLVDGNFFEPELAGVFGLDTTAQSSEALELPWLAPYCIAELTSCLHVAVMAGDQAPARFDARRFDMLIDLLSGAGYDRIVIDAPAIDGSSAVRRVLASADAVLLTVRSGRTTTRALRRAIDEVPRGRLLGATLVDA